MLSVRQHMLLQFADLTWRTRSNKEGAILDTFGCSHTRYCQELDALLDVPAAEMAYPMTVRRLRRLRDARREQRRMPA